MQSRSSSGCSGRAEGVTRRDASRTIVLRGRAPRMSHDDSARARDGAPPGSRAKHLPLIAPRAEEPTELVPARMLNEATDTRARGSQRRRRGRPAADGGTQPYQARSVWLTSESLGLTAKIDIVDGDVSGRVVPIEYKPGKAPSVPGGAWTSGAAPYGSSTLPLQWGRCSSAAEWAPGGAVKFQHVLVQFASGWAPGTLMGRRGARSAAPHLANVFGTQSRSFGSARPNGRTFSRTGRPNVRRRSARARRSDRG
jgi:hypothetical protein